MLHIIISSENACRHFETLFFPQFHIADFLKNDIPKGRYSLNVNYAQRKIFTQCEYAADFESRLTFASDADFSLKKIVI